MPWKRKTHEYNKNNKTPVVFYKGGEGCYSFRFRSPVLHMKNYINTTTFFNMSEKIRSLENFVFSPGFSCFVQFLFIFFQNREHFLFVSDLQHLPVIH